MIKLDLFTHHALDNLNTLGVRAHAAQYIKVTSVEELQQALGLAKELGVPVWLLGGGSNTLFPELYQGLIIHMAITSFEVVAEDHDHVWLKVGAGVPWDELIQHCLNFHYWGLENLTAIPGTVGAAPIQNIGAYGVELKDVFAELRAMELTSKVMVTFDSDGCQFGYRDSVFKNQLAGQYAITHVTFKLAKEFQPILRYPALQQALANYAPEDISGLLVSATVAKVRQQKLPDPNDIPNAGSFFKNPIVSRRELFRLQETYPHIAYFDVNDLQVKLAAAWLLETAGWRGYQANGVGFHTEHALVLINPGHQPVSAVLALAKTVQADVQNRFGVELEVEPIECR